jgi:hypothetical protein
MKTKSALIPGFNAYDVTPATTNTQPVPPALSPTISPAPIPQILTRATTSRTFNPPAISSLSASEDSDDGDGTAIPPPLYQSELIPGFTAYDVTPAITNNEPVPPCRSTYHCSCLHFSEIDTCNYISHF